MLDQSTKLPIGAEVFHTRRAPSRNGIEGEPFTVIFTFESLSSEFLEELNFDKKVKMTLIIGFSLGTN